MEVLIVFIAGGWLIASSIVALIKVNNEIKREKDK